MSTVSIDTQQDAEDLAYFRERSIPDYLKWNLDLRGLYTVVALRFHRTSMVARRATSQTAAVQLARSTFSGNRPEDDLLRKFRDVEERLDGLAYQVTQSEPDMPHIRWVLDDIRGIICLLEDDCDFLEMGVEEIRRIHGIVEFGGFSDHVLRRARRHQVRDLERWVCTDPEGRLLIHHGEIDTRELLAQIEQANLEGIKDALRWSRERHAQYEAEHQMTAD